MIRAVILDFDDTLVHSHDQVFQNMEIIARKMGLPHPKETVFNERYGSTWKDFVRQMWPQVDLTEWRNSYLTSMSSMKRSPPVAGVHAALDLLAQRYVLGLVTGSGKDHVIRNAINAKIDIKKFSFILTQDEIQKPKSDPHYFDSALGKLAKIGISKEEVLFVGDSVHDLVISENTGVHFVGVLTGPGTKDDFLEKGLDDHLIISSITSLPYLIQNNGFHE